MAEVIDKPRGRAWLQPCHKAANSTQAPPGTSPNEIDSNDCDGCHSLATLSTAMIRKPRRGARMQATAQAVGRQERREKPRQGRKTPVSYLGQHSAAPNFQYSRTTSSDQAGVPPRSVFLPRRHRP